MDHFLPFYSQKEMGNFVESEQWRMVWRCIATNLKFAVQIFQYQIFGLDFGKGLHPLVKASPTPDEKSGNDFMNNGVWFSVALRQI